MDLKDVVKNTKDKAAEAHSAFHAGHHDVAEQYLAGIRAQIIEYERAPEQRTEDVTESATKETADEVPQEKPAEVPSAAAQAGAQASYPVVQPGGSVQQDEKPTQ